MYKKITQAALLLALATVFLWLTFTVFLPISLPFLLGIGLALLAEPAVVLLAQKFHWKRAAATAAGVSAVLILSIATLTLLATVFMRQLGHLSDLWPRLEAAFLQAMEALRQWLLALAPRMPASLHRFIDQLAQDLLSDSGRFLSGLMSNLPQFATGLLGDLSQWLFGLITGIISSYMFSVRLPVLRQWIRQRLPQRWKQEYLPAVTGLKKALGGWVLAEIKLAAVAFVLLWLGFVLLKREHSLLLAALITLVDAFPVLGVGTILIPWSLLRLIQGDPATGFGLLGLYAVIWLIRSVLEPKLIGKELGLDPLVTLLCIYGGLKLWGIGGMLLAPIIAMAASQVIKRIRG
jgi:sporulation integral membrane protein YtvI